MTNKKRSVGYIKNLGNGRYLLRVSAGFDEFGNRIHPAKTVNATSDTDAEKKLMSFVVEVEKTQKKSNRRNDDPQTLKALYDEFNKFHIAELRSSTQDFYHRIWDTRLQKYGKIRLAKITAKNIRTILADSGAGARDKKAIYGLLHTMFHYASIENDYITVNPCEKVDPPKYESKEKKVLTEDELSRIVELITEECLEHQLLFMFGVICGMRREEIMALEWSDIDIKNRRISIQKAAARSKEKGEYIDEPKNNKSKRSIKLPLPAVSTLLALKVEQAEQRDRIEEKWIENDFIFKGWNGKRLGIEYPTTWWKRFRIKNNIAQNVTFHGLRHTAATYMIINHVPISTISGLLGHAQISTTTDIYSHVIEDSGQAIDGMEERVYKRKK